jgi:fibronectin type 3 domain-containing protein
VVSVINVAVPSALTTSNIQLDRATMNWSSVANADHYDVRIKEQASASWNLISNITTTSRLKTGLSSSTIYEWQVRSACSSDSSSVSAWSSSETFTSLIPCTTPQNPNTTNIDTANALLSWDAVASSWGYRIRYKVPGSAWTFDTTNTNSLSLSGLNVGTNYQWQVKAICDVAGTNTSNWTSNEYFTTLTPALPCDAPIGLSSSVIGTSVTLSWTSVSGSLKYDIRRRVQGSSSWTYTYNVYSNSRTLNNLLLGNIYEWEVRTHCNNGQISSWTLTESFTIAGQCTVPLNDDEQNLQNNSADLVWDQVPGAVTYKIKWRKVGGPVNVQFANTNLLSLSLLDPGSTYKWKVRSECDAFSGNVSSFTPWNFFTTLSSNRTTAGDIDLASNLNIYPNPTSGIFNISFVSEDIDNFEITIFDAFGKMIYQEDRQDFIGEYTKLVDLSNWHRGIYMVQIQTQGSFVSKRIVLQ